MPENAIFRAYLSLHMLQIVFSTSINPMMTFLAKSEPRNFLTFCWSLWLTWNIFKGVNLWAPKSDFGTFSTSRFEGTKNCCWHVSRGFQHPWARSLDQIGSIWLADRIFKEVEMAILPKSTILSTFDQRKTCLRTPFSGLYWVCTCSKSFLALQ